MTEQYYSDGLRAFVFLVARDSLTIQHFIVLSRNTINTSL